MASALLNAAMQLKKRFKVGVQFLTGLFLAAAVATQAVTVSDIRNTANLTPERFAAYFSDFKFN